MEDMVVMAGKKEENSMNRENQARDREQILDLVREYYDKYHAGKRSTQRAIAFLMPPGCMTARR